MSLFQSLEDRFQIVARHEKRPTFFDAVQDPLGLRLQSEKINVDPVVVVDRPHGKGPHGKLTAVPFTS